jgi:hypothetical protein
MCSAATGYSVCTKGGHEIIFCQSANRRSAISWAHSANANPQNRKNIWSANRKMPHLRKVRKSKKNLVRKFAELICGSPNLFFNHVQINIVPVVHYIYMHYCSCSSALPLLTASIYSKYSNSNIAVDYIMCTYIYIPPPPPVARPRSS